MTALFLSPHNDDEVLFGCFTLLRERPQVIVCLRSMRMGTPRYPSPLIDYKTREAETHKAMQVLGVLWEQWPYLDHDPDWKRIFERIIGLAHTFDHCYAPAIEEDGHEQHSIIGAYALAAFGRERTTHYLTYRRGARRSDNGVQVAYEPEWLALKLEALACYESQRTHPMTAAWFEGEQAEFYEI